MMNFLIEERSWANYLFIFLPLQDCTLFLSINYQILITFHVETPNQLSLDGSKVIFLLIVQSSMQY